MAQNSNVNPGLPEGQDPNFLNYSRGTYPIQGSTAGGQAITGIGNIFEGAASVTDTALKKSITDDAHAQIDPIVQAQTDQLKSNISGLTGGLVQGTQMAPGVSPNVGATETPGSGVSASPGSGGPPGGTVGAQDSNNPGSAAPAAPATGTAAGAAVTNGLSQLSMLNNAAIQKTVSQSYFNAQLVSTVSALRSQYPGYRDYIDQEVSKITGVVPANALRESLLNEQADVQSRLFTMNQEWTNEKREMAPQVIQQFPDLFTNPNYDTVQGRQLLRTAAGGIKAKAYSIEQQKNQLDLGKLNRAELADQTERVMGDDLNNTTNNIMNGALQVAGLGTVDDLRNKIASLQASGQTLSPQDIAQIDAGIGQMRTKLQSALVQKVNQPLADGKSTYANIINDPAKINSRIEQQMKVVDVLQDAVHNPQTGMLGLAALQIKAGNDNNMLTYQKQNPWVGPLQALRATIGDIAMPAILSGKGGLLPAIQNSVNIQPGDAGRALNDQIKALNGADPTQSLAGDTSAHAQVYGSADNPKGTLPGDVIKARITNATNMITNPSVPDAVKANQAKYIFGNDPSGPGQSFLQQFAKPADQLTVFQKLTSQPVTDQMAKLKASGDNQSWDNYERWATNNATRLFAPQIADATQFMKSNSAPLVISFDDKTNHFQYTIKPGSGIGAAGLASAMTSANQSLGGLNTMIDSLTPIYKAGGHDTAQELASMLNTIGANPNQAKNSLIGSGVPAFLKAIGDKIGGAVGKLGQPGESSGNLLVPTGDLSSGAGGLDLARTQVQRPTTGAPASFAPGSAGFKDFIGSAEGAGYNTGFGGATYPLTTMSVNNVLALQQGLQHTGAVSSAMGKNQIIPATLNHMKSVLGLTGNELYDENMQDKMHDMLMQERGLGDYQAALKGGNPATIAAAKERFADNLANEWASLPLASGKSKYERVSGNHATVSRERLMSAIDNLVKEPDKTAGK